MSDIKRSEHAGSNRIYEQKSGRRNGMPDEQKAKLADMTDEQKAKAAACKTPEEVLLLAQESGYKLSMDELDAVSGGWGGCSAHEPGDCGEIGH
jgi:hypothetical protein